MGIKITGVPQIMAQIKRQVNSLLSEERIEYWLAWCGEKLRNKALETRTFKDQTGNLASSIGYVVIHDGKILSRSVAQKVKDGDEGVKKGQAYLDQLAEKFGRKGWVLILSAGMDYAAYVEASGRVVLSSTELCAPQILGEAVKGMVAESKL